MTERPGPALVTGGHGFVGSRVTEVLSQHRPIRTTYRPTERAIMSLPGTHHAVDLMDRDAVRGAMDGADIVVHLAARSGGIQAQSDRTVFRDNIAMTANVLLGAAEAGVRRVFLASSAVVYSPRERPLVETDALLAPSEAPSPYAWSKITDEVMGAWLQGAGLEVVVGRFSNIYGPGATGDPARSTAIHALVRRATQSSRSLLVWGDGTATRSFVYVDDVGRAVVDIVERGATGEAYNVDTGEPITVGGLARTIVDTVAPGLSLQFDPSKPSGEPYRVLSAAKLEDLGWRPQVSLEEGIRLTAAGLRAS